MFNFRYTYTPEVRASIGKYASIHGAPSASATFTRELGVKICKLSVNCIKTKYLKRQCEKDDDEELISLPHKTRGRPLVLGDYIEKQLQLYVKKIQQQGGVVTASVVVAAARGVMMAYNHPQLAEFGWHMVLTSTWAYHFLHRMKFVKRNATTSKTRQTSRF